MLLVTGQGNAEISARMLSCIITFIKTAAHLPECVSSRKLRMLQFSVIVLIPQTFVLVLLCLDGPLHRYHPVGLIITLSLALRWEWCKAQVCTAPISEQGSGVHSSHQYSFSCAPFPSNSRLGCFLFVCFTSTYVSASCFHSFTPAVSTITLKQY